MITMSKATKCSGCGVRTPAGKAIRHAYDCSHMRAAILDADRREKQYNGWHNYETWCVNLWIDNEQALYEERRERVQEVIRENFADGELDTDAAVSEVATWLKAWVSDEIPENFFPETVAKVQTEATLYSDLLGSALSEVDWNEIAQHDVENEKDEILSELRADAAAESEG